MKQTMRRELSLCVLVATTSLMLPACQRADDTAGGGRSTVPSGSGSSGDSSGASSGVSSAIDKASRSDAAITVKVKAALAQEKKVKATDISVETDKGEVTLSGFVDSPAQMDQALKIAKNVEGVSKVTNKMKPRTP